MIAFGTGKFSCDCCCCNCVTTNGLSQGSEYCGWGCRTVVLVETCCGAGGGGRELLYVDTFDRFGKDGSGTAASIAACCCCCRRCNNICCCRSDNSIMGSSTA